MDKDVRYTHTLKNTMRYYSATEKNKMLPFAATWMDLGIMPSETGQRKTNTVWKHLCLDSKKC